MNDEDLIGYLLGALEFDEQAAVETRLQAAPESLIRLEQMRLAFGPLEADRETGSPPPGLATRTIARLAAHLSEREPRTQKPTDLESLSAIFNTILVLPPKIESKEEQPVAVPVENRPIPRAPREEPETRTIGGRLRPDLIIACGIAFFACGLVFSAIGKVRAHYQLLNCQANLQTLHRGLVGYADTHDGNYPQIGTDQTADSFATTLADAGQLPEGYNPGCPVDAPGENRNPVRYAYSLGFRSPTGTLIGLHRPNDALDEHDLLPISADYPTASATPVPGPLCTHPPQMNVL
ncbi:MAG TPA: hypothetical protein VG097_20595, partial [Gemmata sp.]|nr:hypothetical protein [Gemmata sp.]